MHKLAYFDSGVAAMTLGQGKACLGRMTSNPGTILDSFVASRIGQQPIWPD